MKLLVSDFDLTLYDDNYLENIKLVNDFVSKGNVFVIATGRPYERLEKDIENKNINFEYLVCNDGATIYDKNLDVLKVESLDKEVAQAIFNMYQESEFVDNICLNVVNNLVVGVYGLYKDYNEGEKLLSEIKNKYDVDGYLGNHWINVLNKNISKINGIEYIKNLLNITDNDIYTIGDNINDLTMLNKYNGYVISDKYDNLKSVKNFKEFMEIINESNIN